MPKLNQRGVVAQLLVLAVLIGGLAAGVYLVKSGNLKLFSKATNPPIVFKSLDGSPLPMTPEGVTYSKSSEVRAEITSTLGPPVPISGPTNGSAGTISYRTGFDPIQLDMGVFTPYTVEPTTYTVGFQNTSEIQSYWVEFKSSNGTTDRRVAQIKITPTSTPVPSSTPVARGKFVLYWGNVPKETRMILEKKYNIKWINHAGLSAGMTLDAAKAQGIIGANYWPGYSVYEGDLSVANNADLSKYSQPTELVGHPERLVLYFGSTDVPTRQKLESKYKLTWLGHAGLPLGMTVGAARAKGIIGANYWPGYSVYKGDRNVLSKPDLLLYSRPSEVIVPTPVPSSSASPIYSFDEFLATFGKRKGDYGFNAKYDVNGDGIVNILDFTALVEKFDPNSILLTPPYSLTGFTNTFGKKTGDAGFNKMYDLNNDGIVNILDWTILVTNYRVTPTPTAYPGGTGGSAGNPTSGIGR